MPVPVMSIVIGVAVCVPGPRRIDGRVTAMRYRCVTRMRHLSTELQQVPRSIPCLGRARIERLHQGWHRGSEIRGVDEWHGARHGPPCLGRWGVRLREESIDRF